MKYSRTILLLSLAALILAACQEKKNNVISIGKRDSLHSQILNENRPLMVHLPEGYAQDDTTKIYPVVYLLDGDAHFRFVSAMMEQLAANRICPKMILIAIPNTNRPRDLTPTHSVKPLIGKDGDWLKDTGGGENFAQFFEKELIPYINKQYRAAPYRVLIGHSFGGLFAINTLIHHPQIFNAYVAIDPSLWWDKNRLLIQSDSALKNSRFDNKTLFVSVANTMPYGMDTIKAVGDTTVYTFHMRSIIQFSKTAMATKGSNGLTFHWKYYDDDDHGSVPLISEYDAMRFIFRYYKPENNPEMTVNQYADHYRKVSETLGYTVFPPEDFTRDAAFYFLREKKFNKAFEFFDLNLKNFPKSHQAQECMGDYYIAVGDTTKAIDFFRESLAIKDVEGTRKKLSDLESSMHDR